jgi:hypothetical protein
MLSAPGISDMTAEFTHGARYQDLSREQAFGMEARVLQRMFPLLMLREHSRAAEIRNYFSSFIDLTYLLIDVGLGNKTIQEVRPQGRAFHTALNHSRLFAEKSVPAAEAVMCVTDALGELGLIQYFVNPGLSERDQRNPDLNMLVAQASFTLSRIGMKEEVFQHPAANDCAYVLNHQSETAPFVNPEFFSRDLWPLPGLYSPDKGMVPAFEIVIQDEWRNALNELGLTGLVASYDAFLHGVHSVQIRKPSQSREASVINNVTLNFSNGSSFSGPLAVGQTIKLSYEMAADTKKDDLRTKLEEVVGQVSKLAETIEPEDRKNDVSTQLKTFVEEAKKEKPSKWALNVTSAGLLEAAKTVASLAEPVTASVKAVLSLLNLAS